MLQFIMFDFIINIKSDVIDEHVYCKRLGSIVEDKGRSRWGYL